MRGIRRMGAAFTTVVVMLACAVRADVLEHVPADALVVIKVNNLRGTSDKVARFSNDIGLAAFFQPMQDPLGFVQQQARMTVGVNTAGEAAFVFLDPAKFGDDPEQAMVLLVPVADYQAFLGNWPDAQTEGEVSEVTFEGADEPYFVAKRGDYAAVGRGREIVTQQVTAGVKFPAAAAKELAAKDMVVVANFRQLAPMILPKLEEGREQMLAEMERGMANDPDAAKFAPVVQSLANQFLNAFAAFVRDSEAATFGISFTEEGILATGLSEFQPQSYLGETFSAVKNSSDSMLGGLPAGKYLIFGGSVSDPKVAQRLLDDLAQPIVKEIVQLGPEFQPAQKYYDAAKDYVAANEGGSFGLMAPTGALGAESLIQGVSVLRGDAEKMADAYRRMMATQEELMKAFTEAAGAGAQGQVKATFTANAKTVEGVSFDSFRQDFEFDPNDPAAGQVEGLMNMLYGPGGATWLVGNVDGQLVQAIGLSDATLSSAVKAVRGSAAPLADVAGVKSVANNLPQNRLGVVYVALDEVVNTGLNYARQFGFAMPIELPPDLPPIGMSVATEGPAVRFDTYVPTQLVQSLVAAGLQAQMQMQGGRGGGL